LTLSSRTAAGVLAAVFAFILLGRGLGDSYTVFLLPLERDFGWTRSQVASVYSIYLLVHGGTAALAGLVFDRLGPRWVYATGTALLGAAFWLAGAVTGLWQFYLCIGVLVGLGASLNGMVPGSALLSRWYRARLSTAIGIAFSATGVGAVFLVPLAQSLIGEFGWRSAYRILGIVLLALLPVVLVLPWKRLAAGSAAYHRERRHKKAGEGWTFRAALRTPVFWGLAAIFFFTAASMFSVLVQLVAFFIDAGFTPISAASAYGFLGLLSAGSVMASGLLSDRFGYRQTVSVSFAGTAAGMAVLLAMTFRPTAALLVLFVLLFGLCMGTRGPIISSLSARYFAGPQVATIYGGIYSANAIGAAAGALMGGVLHDLTGGYRAGLAIALVLVALAALPFWFVRELRNFR
jgi:MFS family permease